MGGNSFASSALELLDKEYRAVLDSTTDSNGGADECVRCDHEDPNNSCITYQPSATRHPTFFYYNKKETEPQNEMTFMRLQNARRTSETNEIDIHPLPVSSRPSDFVHSGSTGKADNFRPHRR